MAVCGWEGLGAECQYEGLRLECQWLAGSARTYDGRGGVFTLPLGNRML